MKVDLQAAGNWGDALFAATRDAGVVARVLEESGSLIAALDAVPRFSAFLEAPHVKLEEKLALAGKVLDDRFHRLLRNFVLLLIRRGRILLLREAIDAFRLHAERDQGLWRGTVRSAVALDDAQRQRLQQALEAHTRHRLVLDWKTDPTLLGGVVFKSGDLLIDNSLKTRLGHIRERLEAVRIH
ncbi:MAG: ATP synthase F1 subunit delta [Candidatus Sumerlaeia bacterium]|nr:ATP synthase F1 subunit delta [Candidatus Sumerlaeia bacterium]